MAGIITTASHPKALWPGIKAWWGQVYDEHPVEYTDLFDTDTSTQNYEEDVQLTGFGLVPSKNQAQAVTFDSEIQGFVTRYTHIAYAMGYIVSKEEMDDNLYETVSKKRAAALAMSFRQTKENIAANVYNRAFNSTYKGGDGVALCATTHTNTTGGTWANKPATDADFSEASLEDAMVAIMGFTNDRGLLIAVQPQTLHIARNEVFNVQRVLHSSYQSGNANNDINVVKSGNYLPGGFRVNHYFNAAHAWFLRNKIPGKTGMKYYERHAIMFDQDNDFDTMNVKAKGYERYSFGWSDPRAVWGVNGP